MKADRIELYQDDQRMVAIGNVESALYQARRETSPGKRETVPGFATADKLESLSHVIARVEKNVGPALQPDRLSRREWPNSSGGL